MNETQTTQNTANNTECTARSGNTITTRSRAWVFTLNNYSEEDVNNLIKVIYDARYVVGREVGAQGTPHLQGFVQFKNPKKFEAVKKLLGDRYHIEKCRNKKAAIKYCQKEENFFSRGIDVEVDMKKYILEKEFPNVKLNNWQQKIVDIINSEPDNRTIYYIVDEIGNIGKTWITKYLCCKYDNIICTGGKMTDVLYGVSQIENPRAIIFDIPRCSNDYISYAAVEKCKDGIFFNNKYESKMCLFPHPHVFMFLNQEPDYDKLSGDRWVCIYENKTNLEDYRVIESDGD